MVAKAMQCKNAEDLMALAKANGFDITKEEAEAYMADLEDVELDEASLQAVAGGTKWDEIETRILFHCLYA